MEYSLYPTVEEAVAATPEKEEPLMSSGDEVVKIRAHMRAQIDSGHKAVSWREATAKKLGLD